MIKSFRKQIKLIKYGSNIKSSIAAAALFFLLGLLFLIMDSEGFVIGSLYIFAGLLMLLQVYNTLLSIGMVTASPKRRMLETWLIDILGLLTGICYYINTKVRIFKDSIRKCRNSQVINGYPTPPDTFICRF